MEAPVAAAQPRRASSSSSNGSSSPLVASSSTSTAVSSSTLLAATSNAGASSSSSGKQEPPQVDAWIVQKLKNDWSSSEFGSLLSKDRLSDAVTSFRHLDTAIKVRFLLSFLSMRRDVVDESKFAIVEIIDAAENDSEEWVKVGAGIVKQYMFMSEDGAESGDTFFHEQITSTTARVLDAVKAPARDGASDDFFSHDSAFLNASVRPEAPAPLTQHFTVVEAASARSSSSASASASAVNGKSDDRTAERKAVSHRPPMARPALHAASSASSGSASGAATRLTPTTSKPPPPPARKHVPEMSEIRRKADAGRFKRQRSRISMIDIDEVKQIEVEKALKAEERKKQKIAAAAKEKSAASASSSAGAAGGASSSDKTTGASARSDATGDDEHAPLTASQHDDEDDEDDDDDHLHHDDDDDEDDDSASARTGGNGLNDAGGDAPQPQQSHHLHHLLHRSTSDDDRSDYGVGDGTQALLNAAIMAEGVNQHAPMQQQQQQHGLSHGFHYDHDPQPVVAQPYHRGFEPEDASSHLSAFSYGFGSAWGDQSYAPPPLQQQPSAYQALPHLQQFSTGFMDDPSAAHPGPARHASGFDGTGHSGASSGSTTNNSGYLDGPPDYWR